MNISFNGINESIVTFKAQGDMKPGDLVSVCSDDTVKKAAANTNFIGVCISCKSGLAAVQISGFASIRVKELKAVTFGLQYFVADDDGSLKSTETANPASVPLNVVSIDKTTSSIGAFL